jgi:hypothetical protein
MTGAQLYKAIEAAIAAGRTVYLVDWRHPMPDAGGGLSDGQIAELLSHSYRLRGSNLGEASFFRTADDTQHLRVTRRYARFRCDACDQSCQHEYYMLRDDVWREAKGTDGMLCIGCVEQRLGRELTRADFDWEGTQYLVCEWRPSRRLALRLSREV